MAEPSSVPTARTGGVQSLERAFGILEAMADAGGMISLSQLAEQLSLAPATIHRLIRSLVDLGYVRQESNRQYSLGPKLLRLSAESARRIGVWAGPYLSRAVEQLGESVNVAVLEDDHVTYVAQVQPSTTLMRMFTEVGRRTLPHGTAVGKVMLAQLPEDEVRALLARTGMPRLTEHTRTTPEQLLENLALTRGRGYATDEEEQEIGVRCVAVPVPGAPRKMALSMSGPSARMDDAAVRRGVTVLRETARQIADVLGSDRSLLIG
ncbi:IclR family transcriptional regulator [Ornithinimicrobium pratense]|uniref:Glycerol operon regulatory protein n=1 Tax=Ornithinimicrobium pratense TaxID=2593973 RepID=A0A5J6V851_9MICO|nr:IclR family transcriptional regulator [Ornithinimicrobium pratense]QFG69958.1 IclR family transcriptional regulator [Ornithinimicrobium pratense]